MVRKEQELEALELADAVQQVEISVVVQVAVVVVADVVADVVVE